MPVMTNFHGLIPAMAVPFRADHSIDEAELAKFARWLAAQPGVVGMMTNGHTGEVFSLTPRERAEVTRIAAKAVEGKCPVISSVVCEGIKDAIEQAQWAKDAGAQALDIMPPHHWLRFGFRPSHVIDYFKAIGEAVGAAARSCMSIRPGRRRRSPPSCSPISPSCRTSRAFKIGTREMNKYKRDLQMIRAAAPRQGAADLPRRIPAAPRWCRASTARWSASPRSFPGLIHDLLQAVKAGDLTRAMAIQAQIDPLKDAVYGGGEPTGEAHANMKAAMVAAGIFKSGTMRPPTVDAEPRGVARDRGGRRQPPASAARRQRNELTRRKREEQTQEEAMKRRDVVKGSGGIAAASALGMPAIAQGAWPAKDKTVKVIVPWPPGAANDALGRLVAERIADQIRRRRRSSRTASAARAWSAPRPSSRPSPTAIRCSPAPSTPR